MAKIALFFAFLLGHERRNSLFPICKSKCRVKASDGLLGKNQYRGLLSDGLCRVQANGQGKALIQNVKKKKNLDKFVTFL